jgi:hypothetical protein
MAKAKAAPKGVSSKKTPGKTVPKKVEARGLEKPAPKKAAAAPRKILSKAARFTLKKETALKKEAPHKSFSKAAQAALDRTAASKAAPSKETRATPKKAAPAKKMKAVPRKQPKLADPLARKTFAREMRHELQRQQPPLKETAAPKKKGSPGAIVTGTDPCTCGYAPEEHGRDPQFPGFTGCVDGDCESYEADPGEQEDPGAHEIHPKDPGSPAINTEDPDDHETSTEDPGDPEIPAEDPEAPKIYAKDPGAPRPNPYEEEENEDAEEDPVH